LPEAEKDNLFLCGDYLLRREGQKTLGWELANKNFDSFVVPVGNGNVGIAIAQGIAEIKSNQLPLKFIGIQAQTVNPIEKAWRIQQPILALKETKTIASAFNVGNPLDGNLTLEWVKKLRINGNCHRSRNFNPLKLY
jgi:threonine synthase